MRAGSVIAAPRDETTGGRRGPDHSTAGARAATAAYPGPVGRLLAFAIAGHHARLNELRLAGVKLMCARLAEQSDKEGWPAARFAGNGHSAVERFE